MIDAAISHPLPFNNVEQVISHADFLREVAKKSAHLRQYEGYKWSVDLVKDSATRATFFFNFLRRASSQVIAKAGILQRNALLFDEVSSVILSEIACAVHDFRPGFRRGTVTKSWGFEAYLQNYTLKSAVHEFRKTLTSPAPPRGSGLSSISIDDQGGASEVGNLWKLEKDYPEKFAAPPQTTPMMGDKECGHLIVESVKESILGTPEAEVYLLHVVEGMTIREASRALSLSRGKCHRMAERAAQKVWYTIDSKLRSTGVI